MGDDVAAQASPSTGHRKGQGRDQPKKVDVNPIMGVDLTTEITKVLGSLVPLIVEETLRKIREERRVAEETEERSRNKREEELQEWKDRKKFLLSQPSEFEGVMDPIVVHNWTREMESTFEICKCLDKRKVLYASFMLRGEALYWWDTIAKSRGKEAITSLSWDQFKELVYEHFCPRSLVRRMEREFVKLEQGDMSVQEYAAKFSQYARFASNYVYTEDGKVSRFNDGLNPGISFYLIAAPAKTFEEAVNCALKTENVFMEQEEQRKRQMEEEEEREWDGRQVKFKKFRTRR